MLECSVSARTLCDWVVSYSHLLGRMGRRMVFFLTSFAFEARPRPVVTLSIPVVGTLVRASQILKGFAVL